MSRHLVLVFSTIFKFRGGIPRFNQMLCMAMDQLAPELGFRGTVISQDDSQEHYRASGHDWKHLEFVAGQGQLKLTLKTIGTCLSRRPDLLLIGLPGMAPLGVACRPFVRSGFGFVAHGIDVWEETRWSRRAAARRARFALAVSTHTAASIEQCFGLPASAIRLLPNTLDPAFERVEEAPHGAAAAPPELLTVSRLWSIETMKGVDHTVQAFARLAARHPTAIYRIVGKGDDQPRLQELAASLGIEDRVVFEQELTDEELAERYRRCAAFVLPSGQEGFGIVFLEAMRFSKPCIGGNAGGTPDVIDDGETGLLVSYGDLDELTGALDRLLADSDLREKMGGSGRRRLEEQFTFERFRERLSGHLAALLPGPRR